MLLGIAFGTGMIVGVLKLPPTSLVPAVPGAVREVSPPINEGADAGDDELLRFAFVEDLIDDHLVNPPVRGLAELNDVVSSMLLPVEAFFDAYEHLELLEAEFLPNRVADQVLGVSYRLAGRDFIAYAYVRASMVGERDRAALVIPGSGHNQSSGIYKNDPANYHHGIVDVLEPEHDVFVLIKPNEDVLAFHDARGKLDSSFFLARLLNEGGSYSAHYVANALAIIRYLQAHYADLVLAGLSQGGLATLVSALQSEPRAAIIASGYSVMDVTWAGLDQLIIPGLESMMAPDAVRARMRELRTRFLFTYGLAEIGTYRIEAEQGLTCEFFAHETQVECGYHDGGHEFPSNLIDDFLAPALR